MEKTRFFKLPIFPNFFDYKPLVHLAIFAVYFAVTVLMIISETRFAFVIICAMAVASVILYRKVLLHDLRIFTKHLGRYALFTLLGLVGVFVLMTLAGTFITAVAGTAPNQALSEILFQQTPILGAIAITIAAPVLEELMFRRAIFGMVKSRVLFYVLSSLLFGVAHIIVGFQFPSSFLFLLGYTLPGLAFAFLYERTKNIWVPTLVHVLINSLAILMILLER